MGRLRVAILTNYPADLASFTGGVETASAALLEGLRDYQDRFDFHIVSLSKRIDRDRRVEDNGFTFHFLAVPRIPLLKPHLPYDIIKAVREVKKIDPDLIHCQDNMTLAVATILAGYPRVFTVHGIKKMEAKLWKGNEYFSHQADRILEHVVHRHFKHFIAISPYVKGLLMPTAIKYYIPNAVSNIYFEAPAIPRVSRKDFLFFVGPITFLKQVHVLIKAYLNIRSELKTLRLVICGARDDNRYFSAITRLVNELNAGTVTFIEQLKRAELVDYFRNAFALVLPSIQENSPMVIAEAMACGLPVIAARVGGIKYMITDEKNGLLFDAGSVDELANCIMRLYQDHEQYEKIRNYAQKTALVLYRAGAVAAKTVDVYLSVLQNQRQDLNFRPC